MFLLKSIDFRPLVPQKLSVESSINNDVHQKSMFNVHRFYIDEMVETWSAKVCAENHDARGTFFALTFLIKHMCNFKYDRTKVPKYFHKLELKNHQNWLKIIPKNSCT